MGKQQKRPPFKLVGVERPPFNLIGVKKKDDSDLKDISVSEVGVLDTTEPIQDGVSESQEQPNQITLEDSDLEEPKEGETPLKEDKAFNIAKGEFETFLSSPDILNRKAELEAQIASESIFTSEAEQTELDAINKSIEVQGNRLSDKEANQTIETLFPKMGDVKESSLDKINGKIQPTLTKAIATDKRIQNIIIPRIVEENKDALESKGVSLRKKYGLDSENATQENLDKAIIEFAEFSDNLINNSLNNDQEFSQRANTYSQSISNKTGEETLKFRRETEIPPFWRSDPILEGLYKFSKRTSVELPKALQVAGGAKLIQQNQERLKFVNQQLSSGFRKENEEIGLSIGGINPRTTWGEYRNILNKDLTERKLKITTSIIELEEIKEDFSIFKNAELFDEDGVTFSDVKLLLGEQLPQIIIARLTLGVGNAIQEYGEIYYTNLKAIASKKFNTNNPTKEQLLQIIELGEDEDAIARLAATAVGGLEAIGAGASFKALLANKRLVGSIIRGEFKQLAKKGAVSTAANFKSGLTESLTEALQTDVAQASTSIVTGQNHFNSKERLEGAGAGFLIGFLLPLGGNIARQSTIEVRTTARKVASNFDAEHSERYFDVAKDNINLKLLEGEISAEEHKNTIEDLQSVRNASNKIPSDLNPKQKEVAIELLVEKQGLEKEIEGKEESLIQDKKTRITQINTELQGIKEVKVEEITEKVEVKSTVSEEATEFAEELGTPKDISDTVAGATSVRIGDTEVIINTSGDNIVLESIRTDEDKTGQGSAKNALDKIIEVADQQEKTIELKVVPETEATTEEGLVKLYEDAGFVKEGDKMVREPKTGLEGIDAVISEAEPKTVVKKETVTVKPNTFETDKNEYTVTVKDSKLEIIPVFGKAKPSKSEIKKVTEQYLENNDFTTGEKAVLEGKGDLTPEQISDIIATESENAQEVAAEINNVRSRGQEIETPKQNAIAEALRGVQVNQDSFSQTDDPNNIPDVNPYYFNARNKNLKGKEGNIDRIRERAQQNTSEELTPQDVTDFIKENASPTQFLKQPKVETTTDLEIKFESLTGLKPTQDNVDKVSGTITTIETDGDVPFQVESTQIKTKGAELNNLVDRLKKTGLASDVVILSNQQINDKIKTLGKDFIETPLGFVSGTTVYLNRDTVKRDTPIHEFGHLWGKYAKENFIDTYNKGIDLIKDSEYFTEIESNPNYENLNQEERLDEALSQAIGEKGVKILNESKKSKFNVWFKNLFNRIAKGLGITTLKGKQLSDITLSKFTDLVSAELLSGKQITDKVKQKVEPKTKVKEADVTNIDLVIKEQEAIKKTKEALTEKFENKKAEVKDIKTALVKYINSNIDSKRFNEERKGEFRKLLTLVKNTESLKQLKKAFNDVNKIAVTIDNRILRKAIDKLLTSNLSRIQSGKEVAGAVSQEAKDILDAVSTLTNVPKSKVKSERETSVNNRIDEINNETLTITDIETPSHKEGEDNIFTPKETLTDSEIENLNTFNLSKNILASELTSDPLVENGLLQSSVNQLTFIRKTGKHELLAEKEVVNTTLNLEQQAIVKSVDGQKNLEKPEIKEKSFKVLNSDLNKKGNIVRKSTVDIFRKLYSNPVFRNLTTTMVRLDKSGDKSTILKGIKGLLNDVDFAEVEMNDVADRWVKEIKQIKKDIFGNVVTTKKIILKNGKIKIVKADIGKSLKANFILSDSQEITRNFKSFSEKITLSNATLLDVWLKAKDINNLDGLEKSGFSEDTINEIDNKLSPELKQFGENLLSWYKEKYNEINEVYRKMFFRDMPFNEFYSGMLSVDGVEQKENNIFATIMAFGSVNPNSIKKRKKHKRGLLPTSINASIDNYISQMSRFIAYAGVNRRLNRTLNNEDFKKAVVMNNKSQGANMLDYLSNFQRLHIERTNLPTASKVVNFINRNAVVSILAAKYKNIPIQMMSFVNGQVSLPDNLTNKEWIQIHKDFKNDFLYILENSKLIKQRINTKTAIKAFTSVDDSYSLNETISSDDRINLLMGITRQGIDNAQALGMIPIRLGDLMGVSGTVPVFGAAKIRIRQENPDMSEQEVVDNAMRVFETAANRTQQPQTKGGKSFVQNNPYLRVLANFSTTPILNINEASLATADLIRIRNKFLKENNRIRKISKSLGLDVEKLPTAEANRTIKANIKAIINYGFLQPFMYTLYNASLVSGGFALTLEAFQVVKALFDDEDDEKQLDKFSEEAKDVARILLTGQALDAPIAGGAGKLWFDTVMLDKDFSFGNAMPILIKGEIEEFEDAFKAYHNTKNLGTKRRNRNKMYKQFFSLSLGLPPQHTLELIQYWDIINSEGVFTREEKGLIYKGFSFGQVNFIREERTGVKLRDLLEKQMKGEEIIFSPRKVKRLEKKQERKRKNKK